MSHLNLCPLPQLDESNRFFWTAGASGTLQILQCADCRYWLHPPAPLCPNCLSRAVAPQGVSGMGTVEAFTINYQAWVPGLPVPYVIAIVELDEQAGLRLTSNIVDAPIDSIAIGQRVQVRFEAHEDVWLPVFTPVQ